MSCTMISLDTSSTKTGYAIFSDGDYVNSGIIVSNITEDKMKSMCRAILALLKTKKPNIVVVERMNVGRNIRTARMLSQITGVIYGWCLSHKGTEYIEIGPSQWRGYLGIQSRSKRGELKKMSQEYVRKKLGKTVSDDEADAICIGFGYIKYIERMME